MRWPKAKLGKVAPPERSSREFAPDEVVWHLNLDQIESQTGRVLEKKRAPASQGGASTFAFDEGHVLYSKLRPYLNKVVRPDEPGVATTELVPLRPQPEILNPDFLKFYLRSQQFVSFANQVVAGAKMPRIIMEKFWIHEMPLPAPREQGRIVELLEQADGLRRQRAEADQLADRILPALFHKMFGDVIANDKAWPIVKLGEVVDSRLGKMLDAKQQTGEHRRPYLRNLNVQWARFDLGSVLEMDFPSDEREEFLLKKGDLLVCEGGEVGRAAIWDAQISECYFQKALHRVRPHEDKCVAEYLLYLLWALAKRRALVDLNSKATIPHLTGVQLAALRIPLPPFKLQMTFANLVQTTTSVIAKESVSRNNLEKLFATMLHRAFTGELTAKWREAHLKELLAEMEQQARLLRLPGENN